ncbi:something about silencing protein 10 [Dipsacomyces acuminosporus]|nr:something about silencing protein 10 [Dipsacomyces acuminosporus]
MAKSARKGRGRARQTKAEDEETSIRKGGSIKAIKTWQDVEHDSDDDFDDSRDKVLLDYDRKLSKHDGLSGGESDEEVFGVKAAGSSSEVSEDDDDDAGNTQFYSDDDEEEEEEEEDNAGEYGDDGDGAWGKQKYNYYDADDIGTDTDDDEAAAKEEEEEALRLQKKHLEALDEDDFIDEFSAQLGVDTKGVSDGASRLVSAVDGSQAHIDLDQVSLNMDGSYNISEAKRDALEKLPEKQKLRIIQAESPELLSLVADMKTYWDAVRSDIKPILDKAASIGIKPDDHPALAFYATKYQLLMSYLNNVAVYLVIKASEHEDRGGVELRDHPVIGSIVEFRRRLEIMNALQEKLTPLLAMFSEELSSGSLAAAADSPSDSETRQADESDAEMAAAEEKVQPTSQKRSRDKTKAKGKTKKDKSGRSSAFLEIEPAAIDSYAELQKMLKKEKAASRKKSKSQQLEAIEDWRALEDGDFGEQEQLDEEDAEDKAHAVRRLRHHAKRVAQSRSKRENKSNISGDMDIPYKDRKLDKLRYDDKTAESIRKQADKYGDDLDMGVDLDMDLDSDLGESSKRDDDYYLQVQMAKEKEKAAKEAEKQAAKEARWRMMVEANEAEDAAVDDDAKRNINYQILKNKGLMPRRTKEQRNPRVKRRMRYEKAKKKINSSVAQVRQLDGSYGGEATGIKSNLTRSTRLG